MLKRSLDCRDMTDHHFIHVRLVLLRWTTDESVMNYRELSELDIATLIYHVLN